MNAYMRGVRLYNRFDKKGGNRDKMAEIVARRMGAEKSIIEQSADIGLDPDQKLDPKFLATSSSSSSSRNCWTSRPISASSSTIRLLTQL